MTVQPKKLPDSYIDKMYELLQKQCKDDCIHNIRWFINTQITFWIAHTNSTQKKWLWNELKVAEEVLRTNNQECKILAEKIETLAKAIPRLVRKSLDKQIKIQSAIKLKRAV